VEFVGHKEKLASASFAKLQYWTDYAGSHLVDLNGANGVDLLELRVLLGGLQVVKISESFEHLKLGLQFKLPIWTRIQKGLFCPNFSKNNNEFLHKSESYTSPDIYKFLWNF
jgi:hypothetical protein